MQNPSQSHYTTEELFMLKPEIMEEVIEHFELPVLPAANAEISVTNKQPTKNAFWPKYKWYIIVGGVIIIAGAGWYFYNENKKKKKIVQKIGS
jgi:hypothetical protein